MFPGAHPALPNQAADSHVLDLAITCKPQTDRDDNLRCSQCTPGDAIAFSKQLVALWMLNSLQSSAAKTPTQPIVSSSVSKADACSTGTELEARTLLLPIIMQTSKDLSDSISNVYEAKNLTSNTIDGLLQVAGQYRTFSFGSSFLLGNGAFDDQMASTTLTTNKAQSACRLHDVKQETNLTSGLQMAPVVEGTSPNPLINAAPNIYPQSQT
jgi:hypothetical protein